MPNSGGILFIAFLLSALSANATTEHAVVKQDASRALGTKGCAAVKAEEDPYLWLEDILGDKAMSWVKDHNRKAEEAIGSDPRFNEVKENLRKILTAPDRIPMPDVGEGWVFNLWQDAKNPRGVWRRTRVEDYAKPDPNWEVLLDIDKLNKEENQDWTFEGGHCLPQSERCLVKLSHGGKDAEVVREFDLKKRAFLGKEGFNLPEAKSHTAWKDIDHVWVATDFGPDSLTLSGYPRTVRLWKRGTPLADAKVVFEGKKEDVSVNGMTAFRPEGQQHSFIYRSPSFFSSEIYRVGEDGKTHRMPVPADSQMETVFKGQLLLRLRSDWEVGGRMFKRGSLVSLPLEKDEKEGQEPSVQLVYEPGDRGSLGESTWRQSSVVGSRDRLFVSTLDNVNGKIQKLDYKNGQWLSEPLKMADHGSVDIASADPFGPDVYISYSNMLTPPTLYHHQDHEPASSLKVVKQMPARFDASNMEIEQLEARSKDGTRVPYYLVHKKGMKAEGSVPVLLYGYGGFEVPMTPYYSGGIGKVWLENGGAFALANIRGGGEFGPSWHQAAKKENRQKAFDDYQAVAEDLIKRKVTSPAHLGAMGGSNGGLLMGAALTQRPDLFKAVVVQVPLLDMMRYHKLLAGHSWTEEYGNPDDPKMCEAILKYSPYQNLKAGVTYPKVLFTTSTKDDRVHPGHARKMAAKMEELGNEVLSYENIEGGHGAAADPEQKAKMSALEFVFLWQKLTAPDKH